MLLRKYENKFVLVSRNLQRNSWTNVLCKNLYKYEILLEEMAFGDIRGNRLTNTFKGVLNKINFFALFSQTLQRSITSWFLSIRFFFRKLEAC